MGSNQPPGGETCFSTSAGPQVFCSYWEMGVEAFNAAMQSPVRQELRRHFGEFPPFTGRNTHYPMDRTRLVG